jgi:hypothetical protein
VLETAHVTVGAAIATKVANPALAIPLALGSHFVLEKVPHWNPHLNTETEKYGRPTKKSTIIVIADTTLALASGLFIAAQALPNTTHALTIIFACLAASLPDIVEGPYFFLGIRNKLIKRWIHFQKSIQTDTNIVPGLLTQAATVVAAFWWVFG